MATGSDTLFFLALLEIPFRENANSKVLSIPVRMVI